MTWSLFGGRNIWRWCPRISRWVKHAWASEVNTQSASLRQDSRDGSYTSDLASWEGEEKVTFNWQLLQWREFSKKFYILCILSCLTLRRSFESLLPPFYRGSIWDSESLCDLPEVIQPMSGSAEIWLHNTRPPHFTILLRLSIHFFIHSALHLSVPPSVYPSIQQILTEHLLCIRWTKSSRICRQRTLTPQTKISPSQLLLLRPRGRHYRAAGGPRLGCHLCTDVLADLRQRRYFFVPLFIISETKVWSRNMLLKPYPLPPYPVQPQDSIILSL